MNVSLTRWSISHPLAGNRSLKRRPLGKFVGVHSRNSIDDEASHNLITCIVHMYPIIGMFPALPLERTLDLGEWLVGTPPKGIAWHSDRFRDLVGELLQSFTRAGFRNGAMLWHRDRGLDGQPPSEDASRAIMAATRFAVLDANDRLGRDPNIGHLLATAENGELILQPIDEENGDVTHVRSGGLKRILSAGWKLGEAPIPLPEATVAIQIPVAASSKLARAVYERMVSQEAGITRRMQVAIEWHGMAMANAAAVRWQQRIIAIKTGFEILFGESKSWKCAAKLRACFENATGDHRTMLPWCGLLWSPKERVDLARSWKNEKGEEQKGQRSEIEDWFMALANARNEIIHEGVVSVAQYAAPAERQLSRYARWHEGSIFWVGERVLREAIKAHLGPEILLAGQFAKSRVLADLIQALRLERDQDEPTVHGEANVSNSAGQDHDQKPTKPPRSVAQLLTELACQAANQVEISKAHGMPSASQEVARASSADMMNMWGAEAGGNSLLISESERDLLLAAGAEESIPDDWWDAG